jgi:aspartyl-tRNA synthetase
VDRLTGLRTHTCGGLRAEDAGSEAVLAGWVAHRRDHGGVAFIDLRDRDGLVQIVFHPGEAPEAHAIAEDVRGEWVLRVRGEVRRRPEGTVNPALPTGEVEVLARSVEVLSRSEPTPFPIEDRIDAEEALRLKYRYLDLRRPEMTRILRLRHQAMSVIRRQFEENGFIEVETPMLTRSTPEGARDFIVPSRLQPGSFYALPQSPQLFKQLLMVAGVERYFQIVRCFRDEDLRADRQLDFTQLDVEVSFADEEDVIGLTERVMAEVLRETVGAEVPVPFPRLTHAEAMARYGSDKPDTRFGMELVDLAPAFEGTGFRAFGSVLEGGGQVKGFAAPGAASWSRKELDGLVTEAKGRGAAGLVWIALTAEGMRSPVEKHLSAEEVARVREATGAGEGDLVLIVADQPSRVAIALDGLRRLMAERLGLIPEGEWGLLWVTDFPLFERNEEGQWTPVHHPFTAPQGDDLDPETAKARAYDLVMNGFELGGGSIRIHDPELQRRVFDALGISREAAQEKFGFLLDAFRYGVPPHGGIALGLDRVVMLLAGKDNIREVIAFPKTQSGTELLTGAPTPVDSAQLEELGLRLKPGIEPGGPGA